ncbi:sodium/solute symporter [Christensenellaceae bacterium NSJ-63]|uniref:Sodium/solute symporter n=1 Tax=Guopingia tenuis TaxID=2763656 RepID=A0A926DJG4_9FIRM|nr:sodium/solute symporter [Guopingia tenuis]MBC8539173.1 sodium/solute symporter [Guopingia tenuis]
MQFVIIGIYIAIMIGVAVFSAKKATTLNDFYLGGRSIGGWMTAFSYGTTYFSAVMFVGYAGRLGYQFGLSVIWIGIGNAILGSYVAWKLLAKPTHDMTRRLDVSTMPAFFEKRFLSKNMKIFAAAVIFIFLVPYCASVYQGLSYIFESVFRVPYEYCMIGMAALTLLYLLVGGYIASTLSDFIQAIIMIVGVVLMIGFILAAPEVGGIMGGLEKIGRIDASKATLFGDSTRAVSLIASVITTSIGTWGLPQMLHKFYAIRDEKAIRRGTVISTLFALVIAGGTYFIGIFGTLFSGGQVPIDAATGAANADLIMPTMIHAALPEALLGVIVVLVLAASMSTLSSLVLVSSSTISMDLVKGVIKKDMSSKKTLLLMRVMCAVFVLVSLVIALDKNNAILTLMSFSWGAISGSFLAPFLLGVRWKKITRAGAWAGMLCGLGTTVILALAWGLDTSKSTIIASISMAVSMLATVFVSLGTKKFSKEHVEEVFGE